jgi:uncharacterized protein YqeY
LHFDKAAHCRRQIRRKGEALAMREKFSSELRAAMKAGEKRRVGTIRMMMAALKDKEIEARGQGKTVSDEDILTLLQKMTKSRKESQEIYEKAGRLDLATQESEEIAIIQGFLPQQLSEGEVAQAIAAAIAETKASSIKDMGKVVGALKAKHAGRMDFGKASALVKRKLGA